MALRALHAGVRAGERKTRGVVVKRGAGPRNRGVTGVASRGESALHVVRVGRSLEVLHVAGRAGPGFQTVVAVHMTLRALQGGVGAGKSEPGAGMIEGRSCPGGCVVASLTGLWKLSLHVVRIGRGLVILHVAGHAGGCRQVVVSVHVALRTRQRLVCSGERKSDRAVIKSRRLPHGCVVAGLAGLRKGQRDVIGIRTLLIVG